MGIGHYFLLVAFLLTAYTIWAGASGIRLKKSDLIQNAKRAVYGQAVLVTAAILLLTYAFLTRDFSLRYVVDYSDRNLSVLYTISAVWAGQAGSLLFWTWLLTIFNALFVFVNRKKDDSLHPYVITIHSAVTLFFLGLVIYATNPFEKLSRVLPDGYGLNPLLQDPGMIFHPPSLFLGFAGFTIPFACALGALIKDDLSNNNWINQSRNWSLFAWIALTIGNILGAQWAYVELGWGGYWAWDPVENASLLPWLTGTTFIHSIMVQKARGGFKFWNMFLIIGTFLLTILGTFITRSGIISSVHAFGKSNIGTLFLIFMGIIVIVSIGLIIYRRSGLKSEYKVDSLVTRESGFLLNNLIFTLLTVTILWGTLYPAFTELFAGHQITLGEKFFNKVSVPFGILLLALLAICPLLSWSNLKTTTQELKKLGVQVFLPTVIFLIFLMVAGIRQVNSLLVFAFVFLAILVILRELVMSALRRKTRQNERVISSIFAELKLNIRKYSAYLIHVGVLMIFLAIVGTTVYKNEKNITLKKGDQTTIGKYRLVYREMGELHKKDIDVLTAEMDVYLGDKKLRTLIPHRNFYKSTMKQTQTTSEIAVHSTLKEDLYVILVSYQNDESATFRIMLNPLMIWMWIGGITMTIGVIIILINAIQKKQTRQQPKTQKVKKKHK